MNNIKPDSLAIDSLLDAGRSDHAGSDDWRDDADHAFGRSRPGLVMTEDDDEFEDDEFLDDEEDDDFDDEDDDFFDDDEDDDLFDDEDDEDLFDDDDD